MNLNETYELLLNIPNLRIDRVDLSERKIDIYCQVKSKEQVCPNCGKISKTVNQYYTRRLRDLDISTREVYLHVKERQFHCKYCNRHFAQLLDFADLNKEHTHRQAKRIFEFALKLSYTEVGAIL
jgi:transposase